MQRLKEWFGSAREKAGLILLCLGCFAILVIILIIALVAEAVVYVAGLFGKKIDLGLGFFDEEALYDY